MARIISQPRGKIDLTSVWHFNRRFLQGNRVGTRLESAIARVIKEGKVRTYDMGGNASTLNVAKVIVEHARS
jgi:isocitrate/isopropylmalate dehydrogenase